MPAAAGGEAGAAESSKGSWDAAAGAAGFLFLWWIASLLFDLVYVWQRYINCSRDATFLQMLRKKMRWFDAAKVLEKMDHEAAKMAKNSQ